MPLSIQLFGTKKSSETRAAERFFKERGVAAHVVDLGQKGMSAGELRNVAARVGGFEALIDREGKLRGSYIGVVGPEIDKLRRDLKLLLAAPKN